MDCRVWSPTITRSTIIDTYNEPSGLVYVSNSTLAWWGGKYWAAMDGTAEGLVEGSSGQQVWMATSTDGQNWSPAFQPFRDPDFCTNPLTDTEGGLDWQPNLVIVGDELWCLWSGVATGFVSKLADPDGKWTNHRFIFSGLQLDTSTVVNGTPASGSIYASFNDVADWTVFPSQNPIVLANGTVACPVTLYSLSASSAQSESTNAFIRLLKWNALLNYFEGAWSVALIDTADFGDYIAWEPFVVENPAGHVYVYSRSFNGEISDEGDFMLVSVSSDGGKTFAPAVSTKLVVPSTRSFALRVSPRRWFMPHCDHPNGGRASPTRGFAGGRINGALFVSRRGVDDFAAGINFADSDPAVNYPQAILGPDGDEVVINYTSGIGNGIRRNMQMIRVGPLPSDDYAYIHPRTSIYLNGYPTEPDRVTGGGVRPYYEFECRHQKLSADTVTGQGGITYTAWAQWGYGGIIMDSRDPTVSGSGQILTVGGLLIGELNFLHGADIPAAELDFGADAEPSNTAVFIAGVVDNDNQTISVYINRGTETMTASTAEFRVVAFDANPADGDTLTVNDVTFTFRNSPAADNDVQIGEERQDTIVFLRRLLLANAGVRSTVFASPVVDEQFTRYISMAREDLESFSVSESSTVIDVLSGLPNLTTGKISVGYSAVLGSALTPFGGKIYDARVYDSALTEDNIRYIYNSQAAGFSYASLTGSTSDPGSPAAHVDAISPDNDQFPLLTTADAGFCEEIDAATLRIHGEGSAALELPFGANEVTLRWKLSAAPSGDEKIVIATFGTFDVPVQLFMLGSEPTKLYLNEFEIETIADPTAYQTSTFVCSTRKVTFAAKEIFHSGKPRCYLGSAYPERLMTVDKNITFDVGSMSVIEKVNEVGS